MEPIREAMKASHFKLIEGSSDYMPCGTTDAEAQPMTIDQVPNNQIKLRNITFVKK